MTPMTADLRVEVHDAISWLESKVSALSAVDVALLLLGAALVTWVWLAIRALTRLGPIQVVTLTHDDPDASKPDVTALTALLRERLATNGLSAGAATVPGGSPSADLISAIAKSDIPQVGWIAKLLDALPRPRVPTYTLEATLLRVAPKRGKTTSPVPRLRYWLEVQGSGGTPLLSTVEAVTDALAVERAAAEIIAHISTDAVHVYAPWARWHHVDAVMAYMKGLDLLDRGAKRRAGARREFRRAAAGELTNVLARLQVANIDESRVAQVGPESARVAAQAEVLRTYLDLGMVHTAIVEPRYRGAVLAAMLASSLADRAEAAAKAMAQAEADGNAAALARAEADRDDVAADNARVAEILREPGTADVVGLLQRLARRETSAAYALLRPWYVLLARQRLRYQHELRGAERSRLAETIRISRHCLAARRRPTRLRPAEMLLRSLSIRFWHLGARRSSCGWQAFYNGACFCAILAAGMGESEYARHRSRVLRKRAHAYLTVAFEEAGTLFPATWMVAADPDLATLRAAGHREDPSWKLLLERIKGTPAAQRGYPASPWLHPRVRGVAWASVAAVVALAIKHAVLDAHPDTTGRWLLVVAGTFAVLAFLLYRAARSWSEATFDGPPG